MASKHEPLLEAVFNHLVLPPKLPTEFDGDDVSLIDNLGQRLLSACRTLRQLCHFDDGGVWDTLETSLQATRALNHEFLAKNDLKWAFDRLGKEWLALHVVKQNAALLVHQDETTKTVIFEAFEVAAPIATVLQANHVLTWEFPGRAAAIPLDEFRDESFIETLSEFLEQASSEAFDKFAARSSKAGKPIVETRDCPSPALISEMLMPLLEGIGNPVGVGKIRKRVRDDVVLGSSELPWRRSAYWLVLRVAISRFLSNFFNDCSAGIDRVYFKFIMCIVLADLLKDCTGKLAGEKSLMLQAKLCRRLAKLESEKLTNSGPLQAIYYNFFTATTEHFKAVVGDTSQRVRDSWAEFKKKSIRQIPTLPRRAPREGLRLALSNSGPILSQLLAQKDNFSLPSKKPKLSLLMEGTVSQVNEMAGRYAKLVDDETEITAQIKAPSRDPARTCADLSETLLKYLMTVGDAFKDDAVMMSRYLLRLFELWVAMDQAATTACPLLKEYHPVFVPEGLDVLCLLTMDEMVRLRIVQEYIASRVADHSANHGSIFDNAKRKLAFPVQYVNYTREGARILALGETIDAASEQAKVSKTSQLATLMAEYKALSEAIQAGVCCCTRLPDGTKNIKGCKKCWKMRCRKKLKIAVHEDFLPRNQSIQSKAQRAAVVFELGVPEYLASYRMATWKLRLLGTPSIPVATHQPPLLLEQLENLKQFWRQGTRGSIPFTMASETKSFQQTHFKKVKLPKSTAQVLLPFSPDFSYYDRELKVRAGEIQTVPWFQHLLGSWLPRGVIDPYENETRSRETEAFPPSSYQIAANASECPPEMSVHEFSAFQRAVSGRGRRWLVILVELGATNLNFSSKTTMIFFNHLALQAGPLESGPEHNSGALREVHSWFHDQAFVARLCEQLSSRLDTLVSNWREVFCMGIIVTLTLRIHHLGPQDSQRAAHDLLRKIRDVASGWIIYLRHELRSTNDAEAARKAAAYAFWAALLCRQTFSIYLGAPETTENLAESDYQQFFRASVALQENLLVNLDEFTPLLKGLLVRDLSMSYSMRELIKKWTVKSRAALEDAINETWTDSGLTSSRNYSAWTFLQRPHSWWIMSHIASTQWTTSQVVHYHILQGHLLVDGKPLGRLPLELREDPSIRELFGREHLLTRPSSLVGMQYQLMSQFNDHQVHIGVTAGKVVIRAIFRNSLLEHVSRDVFKSASGLDLPSGLVDDCVHWLNLSSGMLEMRRKPRIWRRKISDWILDVGRRSCTRKQGRSGRRSCLVEPRSKVGKLIAAIFQDFEDGERLTIYQPMSGGFLTVEMNRLEILFFVNAKNLLECPQLASEVDPDQDAGTLYGFTSQVVLRSVVNPDRRSIIVPIGSVFSWKPEGMHVAVRIANAGMYARFTIDALLGRLDCAQELNLLYLKAALHALTSFPLPDRLTGRTGTEEAVYCLTSAGSQPWNPLPDLSKHILSMLKSLSPKRHYYPRGSKFCQNAEWDTDLTMTIQYEGFGPLVEGILQQSEKLETFQVTAEVQPEVEFEDVAMDHLNLRGLIRRQIYERIRSTSDSWTLNEAAQVFPYKPRDRSNKTGDCQIYQVVNLLCKKPDELPKLAKLVPLFQNQEMIGGFQHAFENINVQELLDADIIAIWGKVVQICRNKSVSVKYDRLFLLALLALQREPAGMKLVFWLAALATNSRLRDIIPPQSSIYRLFEAFEAPSKDKLSACILEHQLDYSGYLNTLWTKRAKKSARAQHDFETKQRHGAEKVTQMLVNRWPSAPGTSHELRDMLDESILECVDIDKAWEGLKFEINRLSRNHELSGYFKKLQDTANQIPQHKFKLDGNLSQFEKTAASISSLPRGSFRVPHLESGLALRKYRKSSADSSSHEIDQKDSARPLASGLSRRVKTSLHFLSRPKELSDLSKIIDEFVSSADLTRNQYGKDLQESFGALVQCRQTSAAPKQPPSGQDVVLEIYRAKLALEKHAEVTREALSQGEECRGWLDAGNLWPCLSPVALLELLRNDNMRHLETGMKEILVWYGVLITRLQRLHRIHDASLCNDTKRLVAENDHTGHSNWRPVDQPEWLLLEIDNNILIRPSQVNVAKAIVSPSSASNSVLQMNMGEGKTSCIMPMAATMLADKKQLCRLIVPRALLLQTALVIQRRIGRLIGRRVQHIPFQRRSPKGKQTLQLYQRIHMDTLESGGIMLCLPEHVLSFQLSGLQHLADNDIQTARKMIQIQQWIHDFSRDILDESDLTLSSKTQLIYPSGEPVIVDGHPHRWEVAQDLLSLVEDHCSFLESTHGGSIHIFRRHQGYPIIHFLHAQVEDALNQLLVKDICEGRLARLRLKDPSDSQASRAIALIVSGADVSTATWETAAMSLADDIFGLKCLYLLRGLISERIILLCLKKRWNVQFGLHPERAPIAVPFEAKGVPSQTAEYGHPDTALVLTCLAFYQTGLSKRQISHSLQHILRTDDPTTHYEHWVHGCGNLPATLRHVNLLSADDEAQIEELWNSLRFDRHVLNYYMNNFVFPRHAKQFGIKLQTSGWDIPLLSAEFSSRTTSRVSLTTGFSGTNDNKRLLPQTVKQDDLASLLHTNAEVLSYLLEERNKTCYQAVDNSSQQLSEKGLLELLNREGIKILIDAGAHILEMENHDLAAEWLDVNHKAQGAVYFDKNGRIMVRARFQKTPMPLLVSSFAENMEECVVYIDEAHTRGTDLKLPAYAKGAVTLGMGQTKDQTVQAAMRLRQLGSTQSVAFVAPPEVYQGIIDLRATHLKEKNGGQATSRDVVRWLLEQSCKANENIMSLHIAQGFDFCRRANALWKYKNAPHEQHSIDELLGAIRQREDQTIEELYGSKTAVSTAPVSLDFPRLQDFHSRLHQQRLNLQHFGKQGEPSALAEVEQEREVEFEVEQVREKQKRGQLLPLAFPGLEPYISRFVETGCLDPKGTYIHAFSFVGTTKIGRSFGVRETESRLFVSNQFTKTIRARSNTEQTVVRPVEWILWSAATETALVVIPEEAELLIPMLFGLSNTQVWLLSYAAPVTKAMQLFNTFNFFTVPSQKKRLSFPQWLSVEVGIFAGRLYFDYAEYKPLLAWLGVQEDSSDTSSALISSRQSLTIVPEARCGQTIQQPLKFLLEWLTFRRETQDITHTPMGYVCQRRILRPDHSFFVSAPGVSKMTGKAPIRRYPNGQVGDNLQDSDEDSEWGDPEVEMGIENDAENGSTHEEEVLNLEACN
ncbi:hypothetical protein AK830_g3340 [Neonectria ditissima]|uniref:ubiquitinyl hydrolase 1 n=1 Tax=Neonectria ditissima TaxID=78410 RepID=A0A0P7BS84_9HYPO|nr:hypothetical protein AK830_g3340 [Neonectria ditissima]